MKRTLVSIWIVLWIALLSFGLAGADEEATVGSGPTFNFYDSEITFEMGEMGVPSGIEAFGITNFDSIELGRYGFAGNLYIYPSTARKGKLKITAADSAGDTTTTITNASQAGARTYTIPDSGESASEFLVTDAFKTIISVAGGLAGEDTDGAGTNGGGLVGGAPDLTTHDYNSGGGGTDDVLVKVYDKGDDTWDDLSTASTLTGWANNYQLTADAASEATDDAFAVGFDEQFCEIVFNDLSTGNGALATHSSDSGKYQYYNGTAWSDLTVFDNTDSTASDGKRTLQQTGAITFPPPSDWAKTTLDGEQAYFIRWIVTATNITQTPIIDDTNKDEPIVAIPNSDTLDAPHKLEVLKVRVTDMNPTVHDQAIKFVVGNFTDGVFSSELTWTASQNNDKFSLGSALAFDANDLLGICITDDAASTNNPIWAVELEVTYED